MKYLLFFLCTFYFYQPALCQNKEDNKELSSLFTAFAEDTYKLFPLLATAVGDQRYNDQLPVTFTDSYNVKPPGS